VCVAGSWVEVKDLSRSVYGEGQPLIASRIASASTAVVLVVGVLTVFLVMRKLATSEDSSVPREGPFSTITGTGSWIGKWWLMATHGPGWCPVRLELFDAGVRIGPSSIWYAWFVPTTDFRWGDLESVSRKAWSLSFLGRDRSTKGFITFVIPIGCRSGVSRNQSRTGRA
jgi:hypothetical protein